MNTPYLLIDADTGIDDSIAILYALRQKNVRVVGITTVCGNTTAQQAAENTLRLIALSGVSRAGAGGRRGRPASPGRAGAGPAVQIHGENGIGNVQLPPTPQKPVEESRLRLHSPHGPRLSGGADLGDAGADDQFGPGPGPGAGAPAAPPSAECGLYGRHLSRSRQRLSCGGGQHRRRPGGSGPGILCRLRPDHRWGWT